MICVLFRTWTLEVSWSSKWCTNMLCVTESVANIPTIYIAYILLDGKTAISVILEYLKFKMMILS